MSWVLMELTVTDPSGPAVDPEIPAIGAGARAIHGAPVRRSIAKAKRITGSSPPLSVGVRIATRISLIRRMFGLPMVAVGVRSGTR